MEDKILNFLGLAARAGKVVSGEFSVEKLIKANKAKLVLVALDASDPTKKLFKDKSTYYQVPMHVYGDKDSLGHAIGKQARASVGVSDHGFAMALIKLLEQ